MANPVAACIIVLCSLLFMSQFLLEYYIHITDLTTSSDGRVNYPKFIASNKIYEEDVQRFIF